MLTAGSFHTLTVGRISDYGLYLTNEDGAEVLLPNRFVSLDNKVGDQLRVFVYHDSEDRLVASTEQPTLVVGQIASLTVVDKTIHGAFLDWGLMGKHIFLPNRNMLGRVEIGSRCVVTAYVDNVTGRAVATMALKNFVSNDEITVAVKDRVEVIVAQRTPLGYRVVVENRHWGMIYSNQIFSDIEVGDKLTAYVRKITPDNRIDLSLQMEGYDQVKSSADQLLKLLKDHGGELPIGDSSAPDKVTRYTQMSKKVFKRSVGYLMKQGEITAEGECIKLKKK